MAEIKKDADKNEALANVRAYMRRYKRLLEKRYGAGNADAVKEHMFKNFTGSPELREELEKLLA